MQAVNFKALNLLNIVGNPLVIEAQNRGINTAGSKRTKSRVGKTRAKVVLSMHGNLELAKEEDPPSLDAIKELERLLYVKNQTHLLWKPAPTAVPR